MSTTFDMDRLVWTEKERESWFKNPITVLDVPLPPMEPLMAVPVEAGHAVEMTEERAFSGLLKLGIVRFALGHVALISVSAKLEGAYLVEDLVGDDQEVRLVLNEAFNIGDTIEMMVKNMDVNGHILGVRFYAAEAEG